jgi:hypothetical protein
MEIIMRDKQIVHSQKSLEDALSEISRLKVDIGAYEKQASSKLKMMFLLSFLITVTPPPRHMHVEKT